MHNNKQYRLRKNSNQVELRTHPEEIRVATDANGNRTVEGYAVCWNQPSCDLGFIEKVAPYAFRDSIAANDIRLLREHKPELLLARSSSGTLKLNEDTKGLQFHATLPNSPVGHDTAELLTRADLKGMSFGFQAIKDTWGTEGKTVTRTLNKCALSEISIVGSPAYASSSVSLRNCPGELRSLLTRDADDGCDCDCIACLAGDCADCEDPECDDDNCQDCPMQADNDDAEDRSLAVEPEDLERYVRLQLALRR